MSEGGPPRVPAARFELPAPRRAPQDREDPGTDVHPSHAEATRLLAPFRDELGPAHAILHLIARWSVEHATAADPAPHLLTTYWTLEEATGKSERTLMRHLVETVHRWSERVRSLVDVRPNYGVLHVGDGTRPCIAGTVIRFFRSGRLSAEARVKRWGTRDLLAEADTGRTRSGRLAPAAAARYRRGGSRMSVYSSVTEQAIENNWVMVNLGTSVPQLQEQNLANLYADIPKQHLLSALRDDLRLAVELAQERGHSVERARRRWVGMAAVTLAGRFGDDRPNAAGGPSDGFTGLWRLALWVALRCEAATRSDFAWRHLERLGALAVEAGQLGKRNPMAWAWSVVKREGFGEVVRDFGRPHAPVPSRITPVSSTCRRAG